MYKKRMGTRLRKIKTSWGREKKLSDGKTIGGKGRLTDTQIDSIQKYYGNAIRGNKNDLKGMREAVWAIYFHKLSTDQKPIHNLCKIGWCPYKEAVTANKEQNYKHKNNLPAAIMDVIKPVFRDLSHPDLLKKCLDGYTQNANESINSTIWRYCPKHKYHGLVTVKIAVGIATLIFNDGAKSLEAPLAAMQLLCGHFTSEYFTATDGKRLQYAHKQATEASLEARSARRRKRLGLEEALTQSEGFPYLTGSH
uniref:Mutator-like transposase domain-containing protein n=1 Tax=Arion vulgaris TaxID=1028688 RepID=A0A0B7AFL1_9EUPU